MLTLEIVLGWQVSSFTSSIYGSFILFARLSRELVHTLSPLFLRSKQERWQQWKGSSWGHRVLKYQHRDLDAWVCLPPTALQSLNRTWSPSSTMPSTPGSLYSTPPMSMDPTPTKSFWARPWRWEDYDRELNWPPNLASALRMALLRFEGILLMWELLVRPAWNAFNLNPLIFITNIALIPAFLLKLRYFSLIVFISEYCSD